MIPDTDHIPDLVAPSGDEYLDEVALAVAEGAEPKARTQWQLFRRRFLHHKAAVVASIILIILIVCCYGASFVAPYPRKIGRASCRGSGWVAVDGGCLQLKR